jgi:hypothetical protein
VAASSSVVGVTVIIFIVTGVVDSLGTSLIVVITVWLLQQMVLGLSQRLL